MPNIPDVFSYAVQCHQTGRLQEAEESYRQILAGQPDHFGAWHFLGVVAYQTGNYEAAADCIGRSVALQPDYAEAHSNLGLVFAGQGKQKEAAACYQRALALRPEHAEAHYNLGKALTAEGKVDEAVACYRRAIELKPNLVNAHISLGIALKAQRRLEESAACFLGALALKPDFAEIHSNLGLVYTAHGKLEDAVNCFRRALALKPDLAAAYLGLANAMRDKEKLDDAVACYRQTIELRPEWAEAFNNLGTTLKEQGKLGESLACYRRAVELKPDFTSAHSNRLFTLNFCPEFDSASIYAEYQLWSEQHAGPLARRLRPHTIECDPTRRLRVGYVSPNFRRHSHAFYLTPLLAPRDRSGFEVFCYSDVAWPDDLTRRLREGVDGWRDIAGVADDQVAEFVREDRIDILVDLDMHTAGGRPLLFACKPAPVQVCWLAYPGTTGLSTIDYRLTDPYLDPPGLFDRFYSEESLRLPDTFWCYDPLTSEPA